MESVNSNIPISEFDKINRYLPKDLNKLTYSYTTDYLYQNFLEMMKELQENTEWSYTSNFKKKIKVSFYKDEFILYKTYQYGHDDVFFEELLYGFRKFHEYLNKQNNEGFIVDNYGKYLQETTPLTTPLTTKSTNKYLINHHRCYTSFHKFLKEYYGFNKKDFDNFCKYIYTSTRS